MLIAVAPSEEKCRREIRRGQVVMHQVALHEGLFEDGNTDVAGQNGIRFAGFLALRGI